MVRHELSNGLRVVADRIPAYRSISIGIWVKTGSRTEPEHLNGISHFIEHMLFKGSLHYSAKEIAETFDGIGGNVNAFTSKEYTCYYAKVLDAHLPIAVELLSEMFFHSLFDAGEFEKEKNVILEEIAMYEDTPDDLVHDLIAHAVYEGHPLGYSILGPSSNIAAFEASQLQNYMKERYHTGNIVISLAGNLDESYLELLERYFGHYTGVGQDPVIEKPVFNNQIRFHKKKTEQNHICLSLPGLALTDHNIYAMILLNNAIGGGMSSRLFQEIREKRGLAYSVYSYHTAYLDSGTFTTYLATAPKQTNEVMEITMSLFEDIAKNGIKDDELKKGKEQMKGNLILSLESTSSRMNRLGKNELMLGEHHNMDQIIANIESVEMEHIQSVIAGMFSKPFAAALVGKNKLSVNLIPKAPFYT